MSRARLRVGATEVAIYTLIDPREPDEVRYVGMTSQTCEERLAQHIGSGRTASGRQTHVRSWIKSLARDGVVPRMHVIEISPVAKWQELEKYWIADYRSKGHRLTNATAGGDGMVGRVWTPEQRQALSDRQRGVPRPPHVIAAWQASAKQARDAIAATKPPRVPIDPSVTRQHQSDKRRAFWATLSDDRRAEITANMRSAAQERVARRRAQRLTK